jgi:hypothetical protein
MLTIYLILTQILIFFLTAVFYLIISQPLPTHNLFYQHFKESFVDSYTSTIKNKHQNLVDRKDSQRVLKDFQKTYKLIHSSSGQVSKDLLYLLPTFYNFLTYYQLNFGPNTRLISNQHFSHSFYLFLPYLTDKKLGSKLSIYRKINSNYTNILDFSSLGGASVNYVSATVSKKRFRFALTTKYSFVGDLLRDNNTKLLHKNVFYYNWVLGTIRNYSTQKIGSLQSNSIQYSNTNVMKYLDVSNLNSFDMLFLRKSKVFNKGRYSRNRQFYRTGVY